MITRSTRPRLIALFASAALLAACTGDDDAGEAQTNTTTTSMAATTTTAITPSATTTSAVTHDERIPLVVDTDLAADDIVALLYLLESPAVDIRAITLSGAGEVHCEPGLGNLAGMLAVVGQDGIPIACGRSTPLSGDNAYPDEWRAAADAFYGVQLPAVRPPAADAPTAVELLTEVLDDAEEPVTVLTLGPLTNLAELLDTRPELATMVASVYIMGGAIDVEGNVGGSAPGIENTGAEWNIYIDPRAMAIVLASGLDLTLVPLDATNDAPVTRAFLGRFAANHHTAAADLAYEIVSTATSPYLWDPLAAAMVTEERVVRTLIKERVVVDQTDGLESGRLTRSDAGAEVRVALDPVVERFTNLFLRTLERLSPQDELAELEPLASVTARYDGTTCVYDGSPSLPAGAVAFTFENSSSGDAAGAVVRLIEGATMDELVAWVAANPGVDAPPMIDRAEIFGDTPETLTASIILEPGRWTIGCLDLIGVVAILSGVEITVGG